MSDVRGDDLPEDDRNFDDEDRLPWLEAVEEEDAGPSAVKLIAAVVIGLIAIGMVVGGLFWLGNRGGSGAGGEPEVIASPGDYKVKPADAGGMQLDNRGATQVATSEGAETNASINRSGTPEAPVTQPQQPAPQAQPQPQRPAQQAQPAPAQTRPQAPAPAQQARLSGPTIQVGAYPSEAAANGEWARLTQRFPYLLGLNHAVIVYQRGGQTFYRLRAAGGGAPGACQRLRAARQPCMDVTP